MTKQVTNINEVKTMTTPEIAELTGKRHDNVMRVANTLYDKGIIASPQIEEMVNIGSGAQRSKKIYRLNKTESINLVANLSPEFTAAIIDRWQELETQQPKSKHNLAFRERAFLNRGQIKPGYFSIIDVVSEKIIAPMEQFRTDFPEKFCPDISVGIFWANYLRSTGRSPELVGAIKYKHRYLDGRMVSAYQYPNTIYAEFDEWLRSEWIAKQMQRYFDGKDKTLMLTAIKASKESWLTMIPH